MVYLLVRVGCQYPVDEANVTTTSYMLVLIGMVLLPAVTDHRLSC
jgi:hypothetical protein